MEPEEKHINEIQEKDRSGSSLNAGTPGGSEPGGVGLSGGIPDDDLAGDELGDDDLTGDELDDDDLTGDELDDDDLTGDELDDDDRTGDGLDGGDLTGDNLAAADNSMNISSAKPAAAKGAQNPSEGASSPEPAADAIQASEKEAKRTKPLKKIVLASAVVILLGVAGAVLSVFWPMSPEFELETAAEPSTEPVEIVPVNMDAFLIPFSHGKFSYISLNVSIEVPTGRMRNEIIAKTDLIRGRIYDFLLVYARDLANTPVPNDIKTIISKSINGLLSNGSVHKLYLTQFIVI